MVNYWDTVTLQSKDTCQQLPDSYAIVPAAALNEPKVGVSVPPDASQRIVRDILTVMKQDNWICTALESLQKELEKGDIIAWGVYHAACQDTSLNEIQPALTQLLPLFCKKSSICCNVKACNGSRLIDNKLFESRTHSCSCHGCTALCTGKIHTMEIARDTWGGKVCNHV